MIRFFRGIRQNLFKKGSPTNAADRSGLPIGRYLKYSIGEIILVVLGILIALQINNWNEQRKQNNLEQDYLIALKNEFENNLNEVSRVVKLNNKLLVNAKELASFTGPEIPKSITEKKFGELFFGTINSEVQYRPGSGVVNEIINSGKLNIFQNKELKNALAAMDGLLLRIRFQENEELARFRDALITLSNEEAGMRKMAHDAYGGIFGIDEGRFLESNLSFLTSRKLDNGLTGFIFTASFLEGRYEILKEQIQEIIEIIEIQII